MDVPSKGSPRNERAEAFGSRKRPKCAGEVSPDLVGGTRTIGVLLDVWFTDWLHHWKGALGGSAQSFTEDNWKLGSHRGRLIDELASPITNRRIAVRGTDGAGGNAGESNPPNAAHRDVPPVLKTGGCTSTPRASTANL